MNIYCGIDNGTQSTKVLLYDSKNKKVLAIAQAPHDLIQKPDGSREQLVSWWQDALVSCFDRLDPALKSQIKGLGVSGQQHGFVPVDSDGNVLAPVKLWCDTSTQKQCDEITGKLGGARNLIELTGNEVKAGYTAGKILYFKENHPELYSKMAKVLLPHDWINFFLTGEYTMEWGDASGTALLDVRSRRWCRPVLEAIDPDRDWKSTLPVLVEKQAGFVCYTAAHILGIPEGIPVSRGGGDNMMSAIGTGTVASGTLTMSLGTSGTLFGSSKVPVVDEKGRLAAFCSSSGNWLPLLCTMNCTVSSELTRSLLGLDVREMNILAAKAPPGAGGVTILPFFNGERTPNYPNGKGTVFGLDGSNFTRENLCRAAMESSIFAMRYGLDAFIELGFKPESLTLTGGGSNSALWRQMAADICNLPARVPAVSEAAAFGGALQALSLVEDVDIETVCSDHVSFREDSVCLPDRDSVKAYGKVYGSWKTLVSFVEPLYR